MSLTLLILGVIIFICVLLNSASTKIGVPVLLAFILFGILCGNISAIPVYLDSYSVAENVCSTALVFIMFYGGFGTRWRSARKVVTESALMATAGVILTALLTGLMCRLIFRWDWMECFLLGSVVSSTDAASVFSILRGSKMALKNNTSSVLEVESGSNDPCSYLMTILFLSLMKGDMAGWQAVMMIISQISIGALGGYVIAKVGVTLMRRVHFLKEGFDSIMVVSIALVSYALPAAFGGNGFLSAYIVGMIMGNSVFPGKVKLTGFFDGVTSLMQLLIFFMLGLLARPESLLKSFLPSLAIFFVILLIARPVATMSVLTPFRKYPWRQQALISFAGLRGASSIVFAIVAVSYAPELHIDIFNVVFCIVLMSITLQGCLLPYAAKGLKMVDESPDAHKSFEDFTQETDLQFSKVEVFHGGPWDGKAIRDLNLPKTLLVCRVEGEDGTKVPNGNTVLHAGDKVILCAMPYHSQKEMHIIQEVVRKGSPMAGRMIKEHINRKNNEQVVLLMRQDEYLIPTGSTVLEVGDVIFINKL